MNQPNVLKIAFVSIVASSMLINPTLVAEQPREAPSSVQPSSVNDGQRTPQIPSATELQLAVQRVVVGATKAEVLKAVGRPDLTAKCSKERIVTSMKPGGGLVHAKKTSTERWSYGVLLPGTYASSGIIEFDLNGRVVTSSTPDCFAWYRKFEGVFVPSSDGMTAQSMNGLTCRIESVRFKRGSGAVSSWFRLGVSIRNDGVEPFTLTHDAAASVRWFFVTELYDQRHRLIHRTWEMLYHSPCSFDRSKWPTLTLPPGQRVADQIQVWMDDALGNLPSGKYFCKVAFPLKDGVYCPSNVVSCDIE